MLCQNCKKNEANVKYTQIINGRKQEMMLCEECSRSLGLDYAMDFNMPIDFSNFLGDLISDYQDTNLLPLLSNPRELKCNNCNMSYEEFLNTGKLGCSECYTNFENQIDSVLKRIHGNTAYNGKKLTSKRKDARVISNVTTKTDNKLEKLQEDLKLAIKEERYEDAAKIRDEMKKI